MFCKDCEFWKRWEIDEDNKIVHLGDCECNKIKYDLPSDICKDELGYMDSECYNVNLYTGELFGCIHFEKRDANAVSK